MSLWHDLVAVSSLINRIPRGCQGERSEQGVKGRCQRKGFLGLCLREGVGGGGGGLKMVVVA